MAESGRVDKSVRQLVIANPPIIISARTKEADAAKKKGAPSRTAQGRAENCAQCGGDEDAGA